MKKLCNRTTNYGVVIKNIKNYILLNHIFDQINTVNNFGYHKYNLLYSIRAE